MSIPTVDTTGSSRCSATLHKQDGIRQCIYRSGHGERVETLMPHRSVDGWTWTPQGVIAPPNPRPPVEDDIEDEVEKIRSLLAQATEILTQIDGIVRRIS